MRAIAERLADEATDRDDADEHLDYMSGGAVRFDMVRVRLAVDPLPTVLVGTVEPIPF